MKTYSEIRESNRARRLQRCDARNRMKRGKAAHRAYLDRFEAEGRKARDAAAVASGRDYSRAVVDYSGALAKADLRERESFVFWRAFVLHNAIAARHGCQVPRDWREHIRTLWAARKGVGA